MTAVVGKLKICFINSKKEVSIILESTQKENVVLNVPEGKNHIAIVGSNAKGEVDIIIKGNENASIKAMK